MALSGFLLTFSFVSVAGDLIIILHFYLALLALIDSFMNSCPLYWYVNTVARQFELTELNFLRISHRVPRHSWNFFGFSAHGKLVNRSQLHTAAQWWEQKNERISLRDNPIKWVIGRCPLSGFDGFLARGASSGERYLVRSTLSIWKIEKHGSLKCQSEQVTPGNNIRNSIYSHE